MFIGNQHTLNIISYSGGVVRVQEHASVVNLESSAYCHFRFATGVLYSSFNQDTIPKRSRGGATRKAFELAISRSQVQILLEATLRNNLRQVVYTYVPLSPSSITWYRTKGGDALRLGR